MSGIAMLATHAAIRSKLVHGGEANVQVRIVTFPQTRVAFITHDGPSDKENEIALKLVAWKRENGLTDQFKYRQYGLHYPAGAASGSSRVDFCLSIDRDVGANAYGIKEKTIPALRCALARDIGSRMNNRAAPYLVQEWLPTSGERRSDFPLIFHYVNVGPNVKDEDAITDVYMPLV
jgi:AraC family transcriptional regulator